MVVIIKNFYGRLGAKQISNLEKKSQCHFNIIPCTRRVRFLLPNREIDDSCETLHIHLSFKDDHVSSVNQTDKHR